MRTLESMYAELIAKIPLPDYFGQNLNALNEGSEDGVRPSIVTFFYKSSFSLPPRPHRPYDMTHDTLGRLSTLQQTGAVFSG